MITPGSEVKFYGMTEEEYNSLPYKDPNTLYFVESDGLNRIYIGDISYTQDLEDQEVAESYSKRAAECLASWLIRQYATTSLTDEEGNPVHGVLEENIKNGQIGDPEAPDQDKSYIRTVFRYGYDGYIKAATGEFNHIYKEEPIDIGQAEASSIAVTQEEIESAKMINYQRNSSHPNIHVALDYDSTTGEYSHDALAIECDCCGFSSLITKCYRYEDSIYSDVAKNEHYDIDKAIDQASSSFRPDRLSYLGHDANNNVTTHEWAESLYYSGTKFRLFGEKDEQGYNIYPDSVKGLRTGDLVFYGSGSPEGEHKFYGIHHVGIYVKNLEDLEGYYSGYKFKVSDVDEVSGASGKYGYIVHVPDQGKPKRYYDVLRVNTLESTVRGAAKISTIKWHKVWVCHVIPNTINCSGGMEASTSWRNAWGKSYLTNWNDTARRFSIRTINGAVLASSVGQSGLFVSNGVNFNTLHENGMYRFSSNTLDKPLSLNKNMPVQAMGYLVVENNPVTDRFPETGSTSSNMFMTVQTYTAFVKNPHVEIIEEDHQKYKYTTYDIKMVKYRRWTGYDVAAIKQMIDDDGNPIGDPESVWDESSQSLNWTPWYKIYESPNSVSQLPDTVVTESTSVSRMIKKYF